MNKAELKTFAIETRRDLLEKVALRAKLFGIEEGTSSLSMNEQFGQLTVNEKQYPLHMKHAFTSLERELSMKGYEQLIEEVAYTWFNRIIAIRYMEVHGFLPERVHVLSSSTGKAEPDILNQYESMDLNIKREEVAEDIRKGDTEAAYRKLFIAQCNALNSILPFLFEKINDYTELLLPDFLLDSESVISKLIRNDELTQSFYEVEVIGWLYQFYNTEPKDQVFANLKKNKKIEKYDIPAATQLFTPKWIVKYMVENSLGQIWLESNPDSPLKDSLKYYIEPAEQEEEVKNKLEEIAYKNISLEDIKIIDPCVGSGHILVYAFDLLSQMYEESGYPSDDIPQLILEKNLYGLDIDDRAVQLASFALIMKSRANSRRFFRKKIKLNIFSVKESNYLNKEGIIDIFSSNPEERVEIHALLDLFRNAKNFGSILPTINIDFEKYLKMLSEKDKIETTLMNYGVVDQLDDLQELLNVAKILSDKYDVVITNPPYLGSKGMNSELLEFLKVNFPNSKGDLSTVIMEQSMNRLKNNGFMAVINIPSWMFLSLYEKMRVTIIDKYMIHNLVHLGRGIFGSDFGTVTFVFRNSHLNSYKGYYKKLINKQGEVDSVEKKEQKYFEMEKNYYVCQENFKLINGSPFAYWASERILNLYKVQNKVGELYDVKLGTTTGNNDYFLRLWHEVDANNFVVKSPFITTKNKKWYPVVKGGDFRKWFGNLFYVVLYENDGYELKNFKGSTFRNADFNFREGITWTALSSSKFGVRYLPEGFVLINGGSALFPQDRNEIQITLAFLTTKVAHYLLGFVSQTFQFEVGHIKSIPLINVINKEVEKLSSENINISKQDWNSFETSWDFVNHPLLQYRKVKLNESFKHWEMNKEIHFKKMKDNEEKLNRIFIELYNLEEEITPEVSESDITIYKANREREAKSLLSYFIGCMMGRYSLDVEGLAYAGGEWDESKYQTFKPNNHGLVLLTDDRYFDDDIITRLREFLSVAFSPETVDENMEWIAESLTMKKNESAEERLRRYFIDEFFKDHIKVYQKRPIYWLVDSGKQKGLRTLVYLHRYQPDTMATIRFEHLQEIQAKYNNEISSIDSRIV
ncbi:BREX-1 system adenine-specific DNA-methyltransferase PglX, partial [Bacillus alkalicola]